MMKRMSNLPPGPRSAVWSILHYLRDPFGCMSPYVKQYGDTLLMPGNPGLVFTGDPEVIRAIYTADPDTFEPMNRDMAVFLGDSSMILASGVEHKRLRKLLMPPFVGSRMRAYGGAMCSLTEEATASWTPGQTVSILETAQRISLRVILAAVFGVGDAAQMDALATLLLSLVNGLSPIVAMVPALRHEFGGIGPYATFLKRKRALYAAFDYSFWNTLTGVGDREHLLDLAGPDATPPSVSDAFDALIEAARAAPEREDILAVLLRGRDDAGQPLSDDEIKDQLLLLVIAGHETTAISIAWAMHALHQAETGPVRERLLAEIDGVGADPESLSAAPYLEAVCQETLRRYPLAPAVSPRKLLKPFILPGQYSLPEGMGVVVSTTMTHFNPAIYPDPFVFRPERFLERSFSPFEFVPFGGGARRCIGAAMAAHELRLVVGTLLKRFRFDPSARPDNGTVRATNIGPKHGVKLRVAERRAG